MKCISLKFIFFIFLLTYMNSTLLFSYPSSVALSNGNILVVEKNGIHICNPTMKTIDQTVLTFNVEDQINDENKLSNVVIKDKNDYIGVLVNFKLHLFSREGDLLVSTNRLISESNPKYFSFAPIFVKSNHYYFVIAYFDSSIAIKFLYFKISLTEEHSYSQISIYRFERYSGFLWDRYDYKNEGISCEYMLGDYWESYYYLVCYVMVEKDGDSHLAQDFYEISEDKISNKDKFGTVYEKIDNVKLIKTITIKNIKRVLIFVFIENNSNYQLRIYTYYYELTSTHLNLLNSDYYCANNFYSSKTNYIYETDLLSFSCISSRSVIQSILINNDLSIVQTNTQFDVCESIHGHSVIYSQYYEKYYIISDVVCYNSQRTFFPLIGDVPEIKEEEEVEEKTEIVNEEEKEKIEIYEKEKEKEEEKNYEKEKEREIKEKEIIEEEITETELQIECVELQKCSQCNHESISKNLCIKCNNEKGYFLLNTDYNTNNKYIECVNNETKPYNFYFDLENKDYEPCFETCFQCNKKGDYIENNCLLCDGITFIKKPEYEDSNNCVHKCKYLYYYTDYGQYKCTDTPSCPNEYNALIKNKNKCTNNCAKDDTYKYYYNRECYNQCPNNTKDDDDFICKDKAINRCILSQNEFFLFNENITDDMVEKMTMIYASEFGYTDTHVSIYKSDIYTITIYKDLECISDLSLNTPEIIFGDCETKIKCYYNITENLIVAIIDKYISETNTRKMISYGLYSQFSGIKLNSDEICSDDKLLIMENLNYKLLKSKVDLSTLSQLYSQGIDLFDLSAPFYTDVCFQYTAVNKTNIKNKDIALKDRVLVFFPNITLCEDGCDMKGINLTTIRAICECSYSNKDKDILKDNALYQSNVGQLEEFLSSTNIYVIKCYKNFLNGKYFKECIGGLIILVLLIIEIICTIKYCSKGLFSIKLYVFEISEKYINYISPKKNHLRNIKNVQEYIIRNEKRNPASSEKEHNIITENNIIKMEKKIQKEYQIEKNIIISEAKKKNNKKLILRKDLFYLNKHQIKESSQVNLKNLNVNSELRANSIDKINSLNEEKNINIFNANNIQIFSKPIILIKENEIIKDDKITPENIKEKIIKDEDNISSKINFYNNSKDMEFFNEYLQTEFENMDYDDVLEKDKRHFCEYLKEKLLENQYVINAFCCEEPFKPRSIKILFLTLQIDLYLLVNGLFYGEEYVSKIFHLEKDSFSDEFNRFLGNLVYAALVGIILSYIIEWFFIEESRLKKLFKKKKDNIQVLKYEINNIISQIKIRYILFIILTFLITIFTFIHISCFNIVYPNLKWEWLIFSVIIIVFMQALSAFVCLIHSILRFISFKCKSEKIYKISYLIS